MSSYVIISERGNLRGRGARCKRRSSTRISTSSTATACAIRGSPASRRSIAIFPMRPTPPRRGVAASPTRCTWRSTSRPTTSRPKPEMSRTLRASPAACCAARSARAGRRMTAFPPFSNVSSPIRSSKAFAASCTSFRTTLSEGATFRDNIKRLAGAARPSTSACGRIRSTRRSRSPTSRPSVQFVLDHCGVPAIKDRAEHPWREQHRRDRQAPECRGQDLRCRRLCRAGDLDRRDIRPYVEHAIESFGWDRVVWGSDWPVCTLTASLSIWVAAAQAITLGARRASASGSSAPTPAASGGSHDRRSAEQ